MEVTEILKDPSAVHMNMLRGTIAKPSKEQIRHLYPELDQDFEGEYQRGMKSAALMIDRKIMALKTSPEENQGIIEVLEELSASLLEPDKGPQCS